MYRKSLATLFAEIKSNAQHYAIIVDETRDCAGHEQLSMCIRWVSADYVIHEDFIGMYDCPNTNAALNQSPSQSRTCYLDVALTLIT